MCYQLVELYTACKCLYYQHAVDRCAAYGRPGHGITRRTILVGYHCREHSQQSQYVAQDFTAKAPILNQGYAQSTAKTREARRLLQTNRPSLKRAIEKIRDAEHDPKADATKTRGNEPRQTGPRKEILAEATSTVNTQIGSRVKGSDVGAISIWSLREKKHSTSGVSDTRLDPQSDQVTDPIGTRNISPQGPPIDIETSDDDYSTIQTSVFDANIGASSTSSAQVPESPNAIELLSDGLAYDAHLQYLWPQFFLRSNSMASAHQQITRLIMRYSLDLQNLAKELKDHEDAAERIRTAKFVERKRRIVAQNICKTFQQSNLDQEAMEGDILEYGLVEQELDSVQEVPISEQAEPRAFKSLQDFLFHTDPFYSFRENIRLLVEQPLLLPFHIRLFDSARRWFDYGCSSIATPALSPGKQRVQYKCRCGLQLYDDYVESRSGALDELKLALNQYGIVVKVPGDLEANQHTQSALPVPNAAPTQRPRTSRNKYCDLRLPNYWQDQTRNELGKCRPRLASLQPDDKHNFVLMCIPFGRLISNLHQPEVCTVDSDQDFFSLLRVTYMSSRSRNPFSFIRRVKAISFVQLEVYQASLADVRTHPALPPDNLKDQYVYDPMPADLMPPIGSNLLVHLMENPTHAGVLPDLYRRIPKKLREKLAPCPQKGTSLGWGLAFTEGIDTFKFFLCGCIAFLLCLMVAVAWTMVKNDVQGGFGIGAFLLSFMVFCGGLLHSFVGRN